MVPFSAEDHDDAEEEWRPFVGDMTAKALYKVRWWCGVVWCGAVRYRCGTGALHCSCVARCHWVHACELCAHEGASLPACGRKR